MKKNKVLDRVKKIFFFSFFLWLVKYPSGKQIPRSLLMEVSITTPSSLRSNWLKLS